MANSILAQHNDRMERKTHVRHVIKNGTLFQSYHSRLLIQLGEKLEDGLGRG